jgi:hypothetical protein
MRYRVTLTPMEKMKSVSGDYEVALNSAVFDFTIGPDSDQTAEDIAEAMVRDLRLRDMVEVEIVSLPY